MSLDISNNFQTGDRVIILYPLYLIGKVGVICDRESGQPERWIIKLETDESIVLSLFAEEFRVLNPNEETF